MNKKIRNRANEIIRKYQLKDVNVDVGELIINYFLKHKIIKVNKNSNYIIK